MKARVAVESYTNEQQLLNNELSFSGKLILEIKTCGEDTVEQEKIKKHILQEVQKMCSEITKGQVVVL